MSISSAENCIQMLIFSKWFWVNCSSGVIYKAMGFPTDMFVILFAIPRVAGWLAHWTEFLDDPENKIVRPR